MSRSPLTDAWNAERAELCVPQRRTSNGAIRAAASAFFSNSAKRNGVRQGVGDGRLSRLTDGHLLPAEDRWEVESSPPGRCSAFDNQRLNCHERSVKYGDSRGNAAFRYGSRRQRR